MSTNLHRGHEAHRRLLALLTCLALLAALTTMFSPAALGDSPDEECSSSDPAWNGEYWAVEEDDGVLGDIETNVSGATTLTASGSWVNNNVNPVFRVVMEIDDDDDDEETQVLTGFWETGEGGLIDLTLDELEQVTFCFTNAVADGEEPTTTVGSSSTTSLPGTTTTLETTSTTSMPETTTTSNTGTGTTPEVSTPTTAPTPGATTAPEGSPTSPSDDPTSAAAASPPADSILETNELVNQSDVGETDESTSDSDADRFASVVAGSGNLPAAGAPLSLQAEAEPVGESHSWPTLGDLAVLGSLVAAIGLVLGRKRIGRLVKSLRWQD